MVQAWGARRRMDVSDARHCDGVRAHEGSDGPSPSALGAGWVGGCVAVLGGGEDKDDGDGDGDGRCCPNGGDC